MTTHKQERNTQVRVYRKKIYRVTWYELAGVGIHAWYKVMVQVLIPWYEFMDGTNLCMVRVYGTSIGTMVRVLVPWYELVMVRVYVWYELVEFMQIKPGTRVVRGPDWSSKGQDNGEGFLGTIIFVPKPGSGDRKVTVIWDSGRELRYRAGHRGKYDLRVYDTSPTGILHSTIICDGCGEEKVKGMRWKCTTCDDFDLCTKCYMGDEHDMTHPFVRIDTTNSTAFSVPARSRSKGSKREAFGIFTGSEVTRGPHWKWKNDDGGDEQSGVVKSVKTWKDQGVNGAVEVQWKQNKHVGTYRIGAEGCVDVIYTRKASTASGGFYYAEHLPLVDVVSPGEVILKAGDKVIVNLTLQAFKQLQDNEAYGSWNDGMKQCTEEIGTIVQTLLGGYTMQLQYEDAKKWFVNRAALTRKHTFTIGEAVQVLSDINAVQDLQVGHGGWNRNMEPYLGKAGRLVKIDSDGDMTVKIDGKLWMFNPVCITPITDADIAEKVTKLSDSDMKRAEEDQDLDFTKVLGLDNVAEAFAQLFVDMLRERAENESSRVTIVQAAGDGNLDVVQEIVKRSPGKIDQTVDGKTALHVSSFQGHNEVVAFLLENKADVNLTDNEGNTSLHHSAFGKEPAIMKLLLGSNADVDAVNKNGQTSLHVSIGKAVLACVKLLREKRAKCTIKDHTGDTAMHLAIIVGNPDIMKCVLGSSRVDFAVANGKGFNVLQWAVLKKSSSAVDFILSRKKDVIEAKTADGQTALHIAASNGFVEIVSALIFKGKCDINVRDKKKRTPLMLAVAGTHKRTTEILIKAEGIEINAQDENGNTALHIAQKSGASSYDGTVSNEIICNLVEAKADIGLKNKNGKTPLDLAADSETRKRMQEIAQKARKNTFATTVSGHRLPSHWQIGLDEGATIKRVPLSQKDKMMKSEWDQVCERFYDTLPQAEVIEIERVQNAFCWETYALKKKNLEKKYGVGCANELQLFHGTNYDIVDRICQENFDFRRSGESTGAIYGHGAYFAMNAKYSDGYATRGERGKYMFLAKCLVGKYTSGRRSYRKPPDIDENDYTKGAYDSCVDNTTKPRIYCIFDSNQYYPEYVILYR
ncbi:hypothetical protein FSP39_011109 [Pinctada imbricata]|uniref:Poly [ADP-ribose] polymerase n=1 Tax=Pinctada imbricata TaxID=66713 RepID=A0AA89C1G2_PINIB|nr:hypothetical protein FSP39_011109 [Pinctada imbricata]